MFDSNTQEDGVYTPTTIPRQLPIVIYTHYRISGYSAGKIINYDFDATGEEYVLIAQTPLTIKIPKQDDLKAKVIDALEEEKKNQAAKHFRKMQEIRHKIDSLLALEYKPAEADHA